VTTYADHTASLETPYEYTVRARDVEENRSAASNAATVTVPDTESPTTPAGLTALAAGAARVDLSWIASTDNVGVTNYEIYRGAQLLATVGNVTSFSDTGVGAETAYQYTVRALDARQNRSDASNTATVTVPDIVKPSAPANLAAQVGGPARVDLSWSASTDNVGVSNYEIYRNGQLRAVVGNVTAYADTTVNAEVAYQYTVRALDVKQNRSDASNTATVTVPDTVAPTAPTNLAAQAVSGARVNLSWTASTDNVGVARYEVYRSGALLAVIGNVTTYADMLVSPLTSYEYTVVAVDAKQNRSVASNVANATTLAPIATFSPVADAHVEEAKKNNNYGTATTLRTVKGAGKNVFESYLRFDVAGVPGTVKSATLRLSATTATPDGPGVHSAASLWTETTINWSNKPARGVAPVADKAAIAAGATVEYDVKPLVTGNGTVSFALVSTSAIAEDFASRESAAAAQRPLLIIGY
jgi:chitodextrinase